MLRFPSTGPIIFYVFIATCSADSEFSGGTDKYKTPVILSSSGRCSWFCPASFTSTCPIDVQYFPFDRQKCVLKFGSWTYEVNSRRNRPFPSCLWSLCHDKSSCETIHMEMCSTCRFISMHGVVLKQRHTVSRKWPITIKIKILLQ